MAAATPEMTREIAWSGALNPGLIVTGLSTLRNRWLDMRSQAYTVKGLKDIDDHIIKNMDETAVKMKAFIKAAKWDPSPIPASWDKLYRQVKSHNSSFPDERAEYERDLDVLIGKFTQLKEECAGIRKVKLKELRAENNNTCVLL